MAFEIREEVCAVFYKDIGQIDAQESVAVMTAPSFNPIPCAVSPDSINVDIEGIHSVVTRNFTYYSPDCLKRSVSSWTNPYEKPVIMHHNQKDGVQIGRIKSVEYLEKSRAGVPGLLFTCNVGDEEGIKGIKNGTLSTVSIGATVYEARCSICNQNIAVDGPCEHDRGRYYDEKLCYWSMEDIEPKELSYVIVPSDRYANTVKIYKPCNINSSKESCNEGDDNNMGNMFDNVDLSMQQPEEVGVNEAKEEQQVEEKPQEQEEAVVVDEEVKEEPQQEEPVVEEPKEEEKPKEEKPEEKEEPKEEKSKEELADIVKQQAKLIDDLQEDIKYLKAKLDKERGIKESLELEVLQLKQVQKMNLVEQVCELRKELGLREEDREELMMLSEESLNSSIKTFMEFKESNTFNVNKLPKVNSSAIVSDEVDNTNKEVTESAKHEDFDQSIDDWFKKMTNRKYF